MTRRRVAIAATAVTLLVVAGAVLVRHGHHRRAHATTATGLPPEPVPAGFDAAPGPGFSAAVPQQWTHAEERSGTTVWRPAPRPATGVQATCAVARSPGLPGATDVESAYARLRAYVDGNVASAALRDPTVTVVRVVRRAVPGAVAAVEVDTTRTVFGEPYVGYDVFALDQVGGLATTYHDYCAGPQGQVPQGAIHAVAAFRLVP